MDLTNILENARRVNDGLDSIRRKVRGSIMFVDLVGSTQYKLEHQSEEEWLARLATFLVGVTGIVETHGRTIKFIGDEVMGFFDGSDPVLAATQAAEKVLSFCEQMENYRFETKIALDYGDVSLLDFAVAEHDGTQRPVITGDPNGLVVDRCARIASKCVAGSVLCSESFRKHANDRRRWVGVGSFSAKGLRKKVKVFQLRFEGAPRVEICDERMSLSDCMKQVESLEGQLRATKALANRGHSGPPPRKRT